MYRSKLFRAAFVLSFASALVVPPAQGEGEVFIVKDGRPGAEIVVAEKPARMTKRAAADLQEYVKKISGAELPVTNAPGKAPVNIFVGKSRFTDKLGLEVEDLKDGAYRMASGTNWLALVGPDGDYVPVEPWGHNRGRPEHERLLAEWDKITGDLFESPFSTHFRHYYPCPAFWESIASGKDKGGHPSPTDHEGVWEYDEAGTLNAVQAFLYDLGVRWYAPGEIGEVVPKLADIALPAVNRLVRPDFRVRCIQYGYSQHGLGDVGTWNLRLGFNPAGGIVGHVQLCHGLKFVMMRPEMRKAHPEIYALLEGKRSDITPCLSSELLFKKHVAYVRPCSITTRSPWSTLICRTASARAASANSVAPGARRNAAGTGWCPTWSSLTLTGWPGRFTRRTRTAW